MPKLRLPPRRVRRLGVYNDGPFRLVETPEGLRLASYPTDYPFLTFACAVGGRFDETLLFARALRADGPVDWPLLPENVRYVELPYYDSLVHLRSLLRAVPGTVRGFWRGLADVDVVWVLGPHPFAFLLIPLALIRRRRVVLGVRQDSVAYFRARLRGARGKPALAAARSWDLGYRALSRYIRTTVVGPEIARQYGGERPGLLMTTVSQISLADVVPEPSERDWTGPITLLSVGRIDQEKNPLLLVEAMARLERARPGRFRLTWVGTGLMADDVRRRASALGVADRIELLGFVPFGPELVERYRSAHIFVHVSLTEGVPATIFESLASGTPVVGTAVGGVPYALNGGRAGRLVPPSDLDALVAAVLQLDDEPALRDRLTRNGLEFAREHTIEALAARVAKFIAGDGGRPPYLAEGTVPEAGV